MRLSIRNYATILDKALTEAGTDHAKAEVMKDFAKLLVKDSKTSRSGEILEIWKNLYNKRHGIIDVEIESADPSASFSHSFAGKRVASRVKLNPSLLGGQIIKIGDYIIDASIRSKINLIRN